MNNRLTIKQILHTYAVVIIAPVLLIGPTLVRGRVLFWGTPGLQFIPWWYSAWEGIRQGSLPLWNPLNGMGAPLLANYQLAFFYPPNWLLLLLAWIAGEGHAAEAIAFGYSVLAILHLAWAGLGMALFLRRLEFPWLAQVTGGLAFGLSGYLVARMGFFSMVWVGAWLPWLLLLSDHVAWLASRSELDLKNGSVIFLALAGSIGMQLLAGHAQLTWYSMLLAAAWVTFRTVQVFPEQRNRFRSILQTWLAFGAAVLIGCGLAAVQLVPTFEYLRMSFRADAVAYQDAMTYSFWPWRLLTVALPDFFGNPNSGDYWGYASYWEDHLYMGMLPLLLAGATIFVLIKGMRRKNRSQRWPLILFAWALTIIAFILGLGRFTPVFPFLYRSIPTFAMFQAPTRFLIWFAFALPVLSAVGIERWRCPTGRGLFWFRLGTMGAFAVTLGAGLAWFILPDVHLTFVRATALGGVWALGFGLFTLTIPLADKHHRVQLWRGGVITWVLLDLLVAGWGLNPGTNPAFYAPGAVKTSPALQPGQRVYLSKREEYDLKFRRFLRFKDFQEVESWMGMREALIPNLNLLDGIASINNFDPLVPDGYARWMAAIETLDPAIQTSWLAWAGVGMIEHIDVGSPDGVRFNPTEGGTGWHWYRCAQFSSNKDETWRLIQAEMEQPVSPERAMVIEQAESGGDPRCYEDGHAQVILTEEQSNQLHFKIETSSDGWFEIMDTWYPGWQVLVDGKRSENLRADGTFRAVFIPAGKHEIIWLYKPSGFYFAGLFSILVLMSVMIWIAFPGLRNRVESFATKKNIRA